MIKHPSSSPDKHDRVVGEYLYKRFQELDREDQLSYEVAREEIIAAMPLSEFALRHEPVWFDKLARRIYAVYMMETARDNS